MTTDPRTTVELALACQDYEWFPSLVRCGLGRDDLTDRGLILAHECDISWCAAVWLLDNGAAPGVMRDGGGMRSWYYKGERIHDPDPIRATLLAAIAAHEGEV